jgi:hypothetical protein
LRFEKKTCGDKKMKFEAFVRDLFENGLKVKVGDRWVLGHSQQGRIHLYRAIGKNLGFRYFESVDEASKKGVREAWARKKKFKGSELLQDFVSHGLTYEHTSANGDKLNLSITNPESARQLYNAMAEAAGMDIRFDTVEDMRQYTGQRPEFVKAEPRSKDYQGSVGDTCLRSRGARAGEVRCAVQNKNDEFYFAKKGTKAAEYCDFEKPLDCDYESGRRSRRIWDLERELQGIVEAPPKENLPPLEVRPIPDSDQLSKVFAKCEGVDQGVVGEVVDMFVRMGSIPMDAVGTPCDKLRIALKARKLVNFESEHWPEIMKIASALRREGKDPAEVGAEMLSKAAATPTTIKNPDKALIAAALLSSAPAPNYAVTPAQNYAVTPAVPSSKTLQSMFENCEKLPQKGVRAVVDMFRGMGLIEEDASGSPCEQLSAAFASKAFLKFQLENRDEIAKSSAKLAAKGVDVLSDSIRTLALMAGQYYNANLRLADYSDLPDSTPGQKIDKKVAAEVDKEVVAAAKKTPTGKAASKSFFSGKVGGVKLLALGAMGYMAFNAANPAAPAAGSATGSIAAPTGYGSDVDLSGIRSPPEVDWGPQSPAPGLALGQSEPSGYISQFAYNEQSPAGNTYSTSDFGEQGPPARTVVDPTPRNLYEEDRSKPINLGADFGMRAFDTNANASRPARDNANASRPAWDSPD